MSRVAVVTGAPTGIGAASALGLLADGVKMALVAHRQDRMEALVAECPENLRANSLLISADLTVDEDLDRIVAETIAWAGRIDILVQSAGGPTVAPRRW